jgi:predicted nucleic acid-binding protein
MTLTIDASGALKLAFEEAGSSQAQDVVSGPDALIAPDLILFEVHHVLRKRMRRGEITRAALISASAAIQHVFEAIEPSGGLFDQARDLSISLDHPIYDCFYIALAERSRATLVTADAKQLQAARRARIKTKPL